MALSGDEATKVVLGTAVGAAIGFFLSLQTGAFHLMVVFVPLAALIAFAVTYAAVQSSRKRREAFAQLARIHGWAHEHDLRGGDVAFMAACLPFRRGHSVRAAQRLSGVHDGIPFQLVDGSYTTGSGKHQQTHRVAAALVGMPFDFAMTIEAEGLGHKLADALGGEDIDVESDEFSRRFWVKSPDRRLAYDILHARTIEWLLAEGNDWTWHWNGTWLVLAGRGPLEPPAALPLLTRAMRFRALLPRHLLAANAPPSPAKSAGLSRWI